MACFSSSEVLWQDGNKDYEKKSVEKRASCKKGIHAFMITSALFALFYSCFGPWSNITSPNLLLFILHFMHAMSAPPHPASHFHLNASHLRLHSYRAINSNLCHTPRCSSEAKQPAQKKIKRWWKLFQILSHFFLPYTVSVTSRHCQL